MALITIILSLLLDHLLRHHHALRALLWFEFYIKRVATLVQLKSSALLLALLLSIPLILLVCAQWLLPELLYGLPYFVFSLAVLFYSLGPDCLSSDIEAYIDARRSGDEDEALHYAGALTGHEPSVVPDQQTSDVTRAIMVITNDRVFAVLFWFVLLGPLGAALYHLVAYISQMQHPNKALTAQAVWLQSVLAWLPARLLALSYALSGHFDGAVHAYQARPQESNIAVANQDVLVAVGLGALHNMQTGDELASVDAARHLVMRAVLIWVAVLAFLTLGGWLG